ncbi:XPA protein C-terminus-domain-containing protein, partial [Catenaria anguillulae PL171]
YYEYNLAEMTDSRGGFLTPNAATSADATPSSSSEMHGHPSDPKRARTHYPSLDPDVAVDKCSECSTSTDLDPRYQDHFHINVCWTCKDKVPEKYALLTKTEARQDYLLTDEELKDDILFPHVWRKKNPRKQTFHDMYLYLRMHVEAYAVTKWGSLEKMDEEFERREKDRERRKEEKFKKNLERLRKATRTSLWSK